MGTISHIDHVAIVVHSISEVRPFYEDALGLKISKIEELLDRGIRTAFIPLGQSTIELIEPIADNSEIAKFLEKRGPGLHHIALKTADIDKTSATLKAKDIVLTYDLAKPGAHETLVNFVHPKSTGGTLVEIVE